MYQLTGNIVNASDIMCGAIMFRATVKQVGVAFIHGIDEHCNPADTNAKTRSKLPRLTMLAATFKPAGERVARALRDHLDTEKLFLRQPKPTHIAGTANRHRGKKRLADPSDMSFTLDMHYIGLDFMQRDTSVGSSRYLIFATPAHLHSLRRSSYQLQSIYGFIKSGDAIKQVPLVLLLGVSWQKT